MFATAEAVWLLPSRCAARAHFSTFFLLEAVRSERVFSHAIFPSSNSPCKLTNEVLFHTLFCDFSNLQNLEFVARLYILFVKIYAHRTLPQICRTCLQMLWCFYDVSSCYWVEFCTSSFVYQHLFAMRMMAPTFFMFPFFQLSDYLMSIFFAEQLVLPL